MRGNFWRQSPLRLKQPASAADVFYSYYFFIRQKYVPDNNVIIPGERHERHPFHRLQKKDKRRLILLESLLLL